MKFSPERGSLAFPSCFLSPYPWQDHPQWSPAMLELLLWQVFSHPHPVKTHPSDSTLLQYVLCWWWFWWFCLSFPLFHFQVRLLVTQQEQHWKTSAVPVFGSPLIPPLTLFEVFWSKCLCQQDTCLSVSEVPLFYFCIMFKKMKLTDKWQNLKTWMTLLEIVIDASL